MYWNSKSAFLKVTLNFELKEIKISSRPSNSNCPYHIVLNLSLFKV